MSPNVKDSCKVFRAKKKQTQNKKLEKVDRICTKFAFLSQRFAGLREVPSSGPLATTPDVQTAMQLNVK